MNLAPELLGVYSANTYNKGMSQTLLPFPIERPRAVRQAVDALAEAEHRDRGAIHTRSEVVGFILDLVDYTSDRDLSQTRLLEPSCGAGDFVIEAADRLLTSYRRVHGHLDGVDETLKDASAP